MSKSKDVPESGGSVTMTYYADPLEPWERALACCVNFQGERPRERTIQIHATQFEIIDPLHCRRKYFDFTVRTNGDGMFTAEYGPILDDMSLLRLIGYLKKLSCFTMTINEEEPKE